jgi:hypothetical protein
MIKVTTTKRGVLFIWGVYCPITEDFWQQKANMRLCILIVSLTDERDKNQCKSDKTKEQADPDLDDVPEPVFPILQVRAIHSCGLFPFQKIHTIDQDHDDDPAHQDILQDVFNDWHVSIVPPVLSRLQNT